MPRPWRAAAQRRRSDLVEHVANVLIERAESTCLTVTGTLETYPHVKSLVTFCATRTRHEARARLAVSLTERLRMAGPVVAVGGARAADALPARPVPCGRLAADGDSSGGVLVHGLRRNAAARLVCRAAAAARDAAILPW